MKNVVYLIPVHAQDELQREMFRTKDSQFKVSTENVD